MSRTRPYAGEFRAAFHHAVAYQPYQHPRAPWWRWPINRRRARRFGAAGFLGYAASYGQRFLTRKAVNYAWNRGYNYLFPRRALVRDDPVQAGKRYPHNKKWPGHVGY